MDFEALYTISNEIAIEIEETNEFKDLKALKDKIDSELSEEIKSFKLLEEKYEEASKYKDYYPGYKELRNKFIEAKTVLYSNELVKSYFKQEKKVQYLLDDVMKDIISSIHKREDSNDSKKMCNCIL